MQLLGDYCAHAAMIAIGVHLLRRTAENEELPSVPTAQLPAPAT